MIKILYNGDYIKDIAKNFKKIKKINLNRYEESFEIIKNKSLKLIIKI